MVGPEMKVSGRNGSYPPFRLGREGGALKVGGSRDNDLISVFVDGACGGGSDLTLLFRLFFNLCDLLSLLRRSTDLHTQDDVTDLGLSQRGHVNTEREKENQDNIHVDSILSDARLYSYNIYSCLHILLWYTKSYRRHFTHITTCVCYTKSYREHLTHMLNKSYR